MEYTVKVKNKNRNRREKEREEMKGRSRIKNSQLWRIILNNEKTKGEEV